MNATQETEFYRHEADQQARERWEAKDDTIYTPEEWERIVKREKDKEAMKLTNDEIVEKLSNMPTIANVTTAINPYRSIEVTYGGNFMPFKPTDFLTFCRAVVDRIDGPRKDKESTNETL